MATVFQKFVLTFLTVIRVRIRWRIWILLIDLRRGVTLHCDHSRDFCSTKKKFLNCNLRIDKSKVSHSGIWTGHLGLSTYWYTVQYEIATVESRVHIDYTSNPLRHLCRDIDLTYGYTFDHLILLDGSYKLEKDKKGIPTHEILGLKKSSAAWFEICIKPIKAADKQSLLHHLRRVMKLIIELCTQH